MLVVPLVCGSHVGNLPNETVLCKLPVSLQSSRFTLWRKRAGSHCRFKDTWRVAAFQNSGPCGLSHQGSREIFIVPCSFEHSALNYNCANLVSMKCCHAMILFCMSLTVNSGKYIFKYFLVALSTGSILLIGICNK